MTRSTGTACLALAGVSLLLLGCQPPKYAPVSTTRRYASDEHGGAKVCTVPPAIALAPGKEVPATMAVGNDGGWCGLTVADDGRSFAAGLLIKRPAHGRMFIHSVGDATRIDYTPNTGFVGGDSFAVRLIPGAGEVAVTVSVTK